MASIIKVDTIQDQDGNNIINENADTITIGASGNTITVPSGATFDASNATTTLPANVVTTDGSQTLTNKTIDASQLTGTITPSDNTVSLAKLTATGTKDATTFLRGDNTFAAAGSPSIDDNGTATAITIDSSQNVGIGTASPSVKLEVSDDIAIRGGSDRRITLGSAGTIDANDSNHLRADGTNLKFNTAGGVHIFEQNGTERMRIDSSGKVGIGNNSPSATLDVTGSIYASSRVAKNVQAWSTFTTSPETLTNLVLDGSFSTYLFTIIGTSTDTAVENKGLYFLTRTNTGYSFATIQNSGGGTLSHSSGTLTFASPTSTYRTWRASLLRLH